MWAIDLGIKHFFYIQRLAFRSMGFDITSHESIFQRPILTGYLLLCDILLISSWTHYCWRYRDELEKVIDVLIPILGDIICNWKIIIFIYKRKELLALAERIWVMTQKATAAERLIVAAENKIDKIFSSLYYLSILLVCLGISIVPLIITLMVFLRTREIKFFLPVKLSTPFDQTQPMYYALSIVWIASSAFFTGHGAVAVDTLFSWYVYNIAAQFRVLQLHFTNAALMFDDTIESEEVDITICRCIKRHQEVISVADAFDHAFRPIIFVEFLLCGIDVGFVMYQLARGVPAENLPFLLAFFGAVLLQLMIYCYGGQRIQNESQLLGNHIYDVIPWHHISKRAKKLLQLTLVKAQRSCKITGIFFIADWPLFIMVLKNAYTCITLLWTVVDMDK